MDQELIAYLDERFNTIDKRFEQVESRLNNSIRQVGVEVEGLRGQIQQVAEGVAATNQRIDAFQVQVNERFDEMGKMFHTSHSNLHRRVSSLEAWREKVEPSPPAARKRRT
jgi:methyl-accepting chemotaxis protein